VAEQPSEIQDLPCNVLSPLVLLVDDDDAVLLNEEEEGEEEEEETLSQFCGCHV
jgi:hypothetical protein